MNIEKLFSHKNFLFSLEVFPPKKDTSYNVIYNTLLKLRGLPTDFISVTYGAGGSEAQREKTVEIAALIRETYHIEPVAHLTCVGSDRNEVRDTLQRLRAKKVKNILALRGDLTPTMTPKTDFRHASDLAQFIKAEDSTFNIIGACYPEVHPESASMDADIENLKIKIDAGVTHLISQVFFDNKHFYQFLEKVNRAGITVPIQAGIMPIVSKNQIDRVISMCGSSVPQKLSRWINRYENQPNALKDAGIQYAIEQIMDLIAHGVRGVHLYTMNNVETASRVSDALQNIILAENTGTE